MLTWWRGNRKYILGTQRKVAYPILNLSIKSDRYFQWLLSFFVCTWPEYAAGMIDVTLHRSAIWLTNKLRKWTEMYGLKMCLRNVRHPPRTRSYGRFCYHIRVFVHSFSLCCHGPTYENRRWRIRPEIVKPSVRNNIFVKFQRLYTYIFGSARFKGCMPDANR